MLHVVVWKGDYKFLLKRWRLVAFSNHCLLADTGSFDVEAHRFPKHQVRLFGVQVHLDKIANLTRSPSSFSS